MKRKTYGIGLMAAIALIMTAFRPVAAQTFPWQDTTQGLDARVEWLVRNLTVDEKLSLMVHQNPAIERLGLPAYSWWNEALHGVARAGEATVYPMPIALAATFDPQLVQSVFSDVADEARQKYHMAQDTGGTGDYTGLTFFTPNINIFRDPRWGRGMETYGEDPYLTAMMGLACVNGLQHGHTEDWQGSPLLTAACLKHLAVHSGPEGIRHEFNSVVSHRDLRTTYLPAFEYIIKNSDVQQVMCGYNRINGAPCCTNRELFDILRNEWHYDGLLVTDCWALNDAYEQDTVIPRHRTHATAAAAYGDAFGREVDLECGSGLPALREAWSAGILPAEKIDEHVRRILRTRLLVTNEPTPSEEFVCRDPFPFAPATNNIVLLKNDHTLPIERHTRIYLTGPNAEDTLMPLGNYNGTPRHTYSIRRGLELFYDLVATPDSADLIVYAGGLSPQLEGEELPVDTPGFYRGDRTLIELPAGQVADLHAWSAGGTPADGQPASRRHIPVVLVLCTGSAIALENVVDDVDAILVAWYGGEDMGGAVALQMLRQGAHIFGRLPVTFYRNTQQLPDFEDYDMQGRTYRYMTDEPLYPFGYGLTYVGHHIETAAFDADSLTVTATLRGDYCLGGIPSTMACVQVYLSNPADPAAPRKQLVGLGSRWVDVGETTTVTIHLDPFWLRQYNPKTARMEEPADGTPLTLRIGLSSADSDLLDLPVTYRRK
ncbi:MAG: glycoside hydrolase family 3 C-terminal domain-containing protein [Bacteroidales bacterium]|nr:glycoside hydrolase family 3 C-terminal domain-containing protein [Bacteroidales bacterium]